MITINDLAFAYGSTKVLDSITMTMKDGRIYGLLGENGVGKTTLLSLLAGLLKPGSGSIDIDGDAPYGRKPGFLSDIYYLPDNVPALTVTAERFARNNGVFWPDFNMDHFMDIMHLFENPTDRKMNAMSAGQLKKTHIAFSLACGAHYIFMDEPTNGLDIPSKSQFRSVIMKYTRDDSTIVISTHQVRDLENVIDPIIILDRQRVLLNASIEEISAKLYFDYGAELRPDSLYLEKLPGGFIQVCPNLTGEESKVNLEALFNTVHSHKDLFYE